jgi:hypothetical protein
VPIPHNDSERRGCSNSFADFTLSASADRARFLYVLIRAFVIGQYAIQVKLERMTALWTQGVNLFFFFFFHDESPLFFEAPYG